jgi:hypothetical protein
MIVHINGVFSHQAVAPLDANHSFWDSSYFDLCNSHIATAVTLFQAPSRNSFAPRPGDLAKAGRTPGREPGDEVIAGKIGDCTKPAQTAGRKRPEKCAGWGVRDETALSMPNMVRLKAMGQPWEGDVTGADQQRLARWGEQWGFAMICVPEHHIIPRAHVEPSGAHAVPDQA